MAKKKLNLEALKLEIQLLKSKKDSNELHLQELLAKKQRLEKSIQQLQDKIALQNKRGTELMNLYNEESAKQNSQK